MKTSIFHVKEVVDTVAFFVGPSPTYDPENISSEPMYVIYSILHGSGKEELCREDTKKMRMEAMRAANKRARSGKTRGQDIFVWIKAFPYKAKRVHFGSGYFAFESPAALRLHLLVRGRRIDVGGIDVFNYDWSIEGRSFPLELLYGDILLGNPPLGTSPLPKLKMIL